MNLRQRLRQSAPLHNVFMTLPSPRLAERMAATGVESITLDMQHGSIEDGHLLGLLQAIRAGGGLALTRLAWNRPELTMKALDYGVEGVICPMVDTPEEARAFVRAAKYPPVGNRSFGPFRAALHYDGDYFAAANGETLAFVMIETAAAAEQLDAIAATPGLDGLYIGPYDLSVSLGLADRADFSDPQLSAVLDRVIESAARHNLFTGIFTTRPTDVAGLVQRGFDIVTCGTEELIFQRGLRDWMADF
ncbi:HpcH/HpaI aldolase/citrate lyase family protein [Lewinella sp. JB7]|uniref:HpcH/HpaI aldolase family protein n=1 Tax=Lewinella sp. JB7 TaxID=2962887 RepID=UPI0020C9DAAE|nr:aldolase/citrate lyase family protein [Lewinella sp. JB7]MCP9234608.1 aldolase/citrate lyase family protein [Lewinella sp. JB7]